MNVQDLIEALRSQTQPIQEILSRHCKLEILQEIPDELWHMLACDLAERAILKLNASGREQPASQLEHIETKRAWVVEKASEKDRADAYSIAYRYEHNKQIAWWLAGGESLLEDPETRDEGRQQRAETEAALAVCFVCQAQQPHLLTSKVSSKSHNVFVLLAPEQSPKEYEWQARRFTWWLSKLDQSPDAWQAALHNPASSDCPEDTTLSFAL
ncbi:MAG: hypothetical protein CL932_22705 [Deltaproteobacteria bacterium]|nr:hypothetical protein [Deltaproteobacteria bacterium]|tara:strand:+ start:4205 stop:4843 length:639 start_codon:yes stop_codon:yes gene_type:complete